MPAHGTWQQTGNSSSGGGVLVAAAVAVLLLCCGGGAAAAVAATIEDALITVAVILGVIIAAAVPCVIWLMRRRAALDAAATADYRAWVEADDERRRAQDLERHQRAVEIAAASAPKIILGADLLAAAAAGAQLQPVRVVRGEVER